MPYEKKWIGFMDVKFELEDKGLGVRLTITSPDPDAPPPDVMEFPDTEFAFLVARRFLKRIEQKYARAKDQIDIARAIAIPAGALVAAFTGREPQKDS